MSPPFASSEGVSASGDRLQSDGVQDTHLLPHSLSPRVHERVYDFALTHSLSSFAYFAFISSSLHIIFVDRLLLHIESPLLMLPHLVLIQQRCVDPCPGRIRSPLHDSSRTIDAYSSLHRFSSRSTNATISESPLATFPAQ